MTILKTLVHSSICFSTSIFCSNVLRGTIIFQCKRGAELLVRQIFMVIRYLYANAFTNSLMNWKMIVEMRLPSWLQGRTLFTEWLAICRPFCSGQTFVITTLVYMINTAFNCRDFQKGMQVCRFNGGLCSQINNNGVNSQTIRWTLEGLASHYTAGKFRTWIFDYFGVYCNLQNVSK